MTKFVRNFMYRLFLEVIITLFVHIFEIQPSTDLSYVFSRFDFIYFPHIYTIFYCGAALSDYILINTITFTFFFLACR